MCPPNAAPELTENGGWRRKQITLPIPPAPVHLRAMVVGVATRPGTTGATGLATYVASGRTAGQTTWAVVAIAVSLLAAETVQRTVEARGRLSAPSQSSDTCGHCGS